MGNLTPASCGNTSDFIADSEVVLSCRKQGVKRPLWVSGWGRGQARHTRKLCESVVTGKRAFLHHIPMSKIETGERAAAPLYYTVPAQLCVQHQRRLKLKLKVQLHLHHISTKRCFVFKYLLVFGKKWQLLSKQGSLQLKQTEQNKYRTEQIFLDSDCPKLTAAFSGFSLFTDEACN